MGAWLWIWACQDDYDNLFICRPECRRPDIICTRTPFITPVLKSNQCTFLNVISTFTSHTVGKRFLLLTHSPVAASRFWLIRLNLTCCLDTRNSCERCWTTHVRWKRLLRISSHPFPSLAARRREQISLHAVVFSNVVFAALLNI